jgi:S-adenosylmethionine hydrolase
MGLPKLEQGERMIALFTDFGRRDAYVAQMKGAILTINPHVRLIDLNHEVGQFDIHGAAYILATSARFFPAGTIFVAVVDPGVGSSRRPLALQTRADKWYVGPDNGLFSRVIEHEGMRQAHALESAAYFRAPQVSATFHGRDIFAPVAAHLALGVLPEQLGPRVTDVITWPRSQPQVTADKVVGEVEHIDHFGNVITNIGATLLGHLQLGQHVACTIAGRVYTLPFVQTYADGVPDQLIGLINSDDAFELAMARGSAADRLRVRVGDRLRLEPTVEAGGDVVV